MLKSNCLVIAAAVAVAASPLLAQEKGMPGNLMRSSHVVGMDVRNAANENLGDIKEVVLDKEKGKIAYAVVSFGGVLNLGDKFFAVPWESLKPSADGKAFLLDIPKDRLEKAKGFDKDNWPNMADAAWATEIRKFYGAAAPAMHDDRQVDGMGRDNLRDRLRERFTNGARQTLTHAGTIKTFERGEPSRLVITTTQGEIHADVGPASFLDQNQLKFDAGSPISVRGYEMTKDGRPTLIVTEVVANERTVALQRSDAARISGDVVTSAAGESQYPIREMTGTVTYVESGACEESGYGRQVTIRTADGERTVALAPGTYLDERRWVLSPRDSITVRGYDYDRNGTRTFIATELRRGNDTWQFRRADLTPLWGR
jgi:sporulation protein YlmC with PRC-barrel domain